MTNVPHSFLFYDYETFGINPAQDRIAQFAALRTDANFNVIADPINIYCKQYEDTLPSPEAIVITGITPQLCNAQGLHEAAFTHQIHEQFSEPNTCILGYNSIRFDDEMTRYLFYRNFYDPYAYAWQNNNSRWDIIDLVRATYALRPEGINWPQEEGFVSFRLERLSKANQLNHERAHDALSDVYATIAMTKLIKEKQPRLFNYFFNHRLANTLKPLIDTTNLTPLVHISGMFGRERGNLSLIAPISMHPWNKNAVICIDLMGSLDSLITDEATTLSHELYLPTEALPVGKKRIPLKQVHLNKCPILAPLNTLKDCTNLHGLDLDHAIANLGLLKEHVDKLLPKILTIFSQKPVFNNDHVEAKLYEGFFSARDRQAMDQLRMLPAEKLADHGLNFSDARIAPLLFLYRAKNHFAQLTAAEQQAWHEYAANRRAQLKPAYQQRYQELLVHYQDDPEKLALLMHCAPYYQ